MIHAIVVLTIIMYLAITTSREFCEQARVNTAPLAWSPFFQSIINRPGGEVSGTK